MESQVMEVDEPRETSNLLNTSRESLTQATEDSSVSAVYHNETINTIETELKQLISVKVSEKISSISLCNEGNCLESVHSFLIQEIHNAAYCNQTLLQQIDSDALALSRSKQLVLELSKHCEKLGDCYKSLRSKIDSMKNYNRLRLYKEQFEEIAGLEEDYAGRIQEKKESLRVELEGSAEKLKEREGILKNMKEKDFVELEKTENDLEGKIAELEIAKLSLANELKTSENEGYKEAQAGILSKQEEKIAKLEAEKLKQIELVNSLVLTQNELKNEQETRVLLCENSKIAACNLTEEIKKKSEHLTTLEDQLREFQRLKETQANEMNEEYKKLKAVAREKQERLHAAKLTTQKMKQELEKHKSDFVEHSEQKSAMIKSLEEQKNRTHSLQTNLNEKKASIAAIQEKFQLLQVKESELCDSLAKVNSEIIEETEKHERATAENSEKIENLTNKLKELNEMARSKEYLVLSNQYLREKLDDLQKELDKSSQTVKTQDEEKSNVSRILETKRKTFDELKRKLESMQKKKETAEPVKSVLRSTGKEKTSEKSVKFNELLSFKSITESESSQGDLSQSKSLQDWINSLK